MNGEKGQSRTWKDIIPEPHIPEGRVEFLFTGNESFGGHGATSPVLEKTKLPKSWTVQTYREAILSIAKKPAYAYKNSSFTFLLGEFEGVVIELALATTSNPENLLVHASPYSGKGVQFLNKQGIIEEVRIPIRWRRYFRVVW